MIEFCNNITATIFIFAIVAGIIYLVSFAVVYLFAGIVVGVVLCILVSIGYWFFKGIRYLIERG